MKEGNRKPQTGIRKETEAEGALALCRQIPGWDPERWEYQINAAAEEGDEWYRHASDSWFPIASVGAKFTLLRRPKQQPVEWITPTDEDAKSRPEEISPGKYLQRQYPRKHLYHCFLCGTQLVEAGMGCLFCTECQASYLPTVRDDRPCLECCEEGKES